MICCQLNDDVDADDGKDDTYYSLLLAGLMTYGALYDDDHDKMMMMMLAMVKMIQIMACCWPAS